MPKQRNRRRTKKKNINEFNVYDNEEIIMKNKMLFKLLAGWIISMALFFFLVPVPAFSAEFSADLVITAPDSNYTFKLYVKDTMYRLEKVKGGMKYPPFPTIVNRSTGLTWGLNPQARQYVEMKNIRQTMIMNPLVGWEMTRKGMTMSQGGTETVSGYKCQTFEYREPGKPQLAAKVWVARKLNFTLKEVRYGANANPTLELKNIKKEPVDAALFKIPPGYTKAGTAPGSSHSKAKKSAKTKKPLSKTLDVKRMSAHGISLEPDRHIVITATGNSPGGSVSSAYMKVLDKGNNEIIAEKITLKNGEIRTWEVTPDKEPWTLSLSGEKGLIKFKVDQLADEPASALQTPQTAIEKPMADSAPEKSVAPSNLMFILDASGSMWGQVEGKAKIAIAKEVLVGLIKDLPNDAVVGLVAYGHRRKGDCDDVEELIALGPLNKPAMAAQIQQLNPKGKTPISRSVRLTAERIKHLEDETAIILVSDGKETCDPDPCGLVKELKGTGIKFVMHVIGFDVTEEEREQLECMAKAGGGTYYTAGNAGEFLAAAREVVEAPTFTGGYLKITSLKEGQPFEARADVYRQSDNKSMGAKNTWHRQKPAEYKLVPGTYYLKVADRSVTPHQRQEIRDIEIVSGQTLEKTIAFGSAGILRITAKKEGQPFEARADVYRQSDNKSMGAKNTWHRQKPAEYKLVPGIYRVSVLDRSVTPHQRQEIRDIEIVSGQTVEKTVSFVAGGTLFIKAVKEGQPFEARADVYRQSDNKRMGDKNTWYRKKPAEFKLVPGIYYIKVYDRKTKEKKEIRDIEIISGQTMEKSVAF